MSDGYNGWTNYETWNVAPWLDNEEGTQGHWAGRAQELVDEQGREEATPNLADELKEWHEENKPELNGVFADLMGAALDAVNWFEIAEHYTGDCDEPEPQNEEADEYSVPGSV